MLWAYLGRDAIVTHTNGATFRGRIGWSWTVGWVKLRNPQVVDGSLAEAAHLATNQLLGQLLLPGAHLEAVQVL